MKQLTISEIQTIEGGGAPVGGVGGRSSGGPGRTCMILGGLVLGSVLGGFFAPPLWGAAATMTGAAAIYGCF
jgi:hypothetical protein